jgi:hypothetical protein
MKNFVKTLDRNGLLFSFLCEKFSKLSAEKIKPTVFIGPHIHQLFRNCSVSLKMHFFHSYLDSIPINCGTGTDEHGERFHQDILAMENRYKGKWTAAILSDGEEGYSGNSVQTTSEKEPRLNHVIALLCLASIQQYKQTVLKPEPIP